MDCAHPLHAHLDTLTVCRLRRWIRYGDSLRTGWKNLLACVMRLFQLNLLPPAVLLLESEDSASAKERLPRPSASRRTPASASLLSRAFSR